MQPNYKIAPRINDIGASDGNITRDLENLRLVTPDGTQTFCFLYSVLEEEQKTEFEI